MDVDLWDVAYTAKMAAKDIRAAVKALMEGSGNPVAMLEEIAADLQELANRILDS